MSVSNSTDLNDLVGQIVHDEALSYAYSTRVMRPLINAIQVAQGANTIVVPQFSGVYVQSLTEGAAPSSETLATTGVTLTPSERGAYVQISKHVLFGDPYTDLEPYGEQMGRALAEDEDKLITALYAFGNTVGASGDTLTKDHFASGVSLLEAANAPHPYSAVFHPVAWASLRVSLADAGVNADVGKQIVEGFGDGVTNLNGFVGSYMGVPTYITTQINTTGAKYNNMMFSKKAISYAFMQDIRVDVDDNIPARAFDLMGWYAGEAKEQVDAYGVLIESGTV